MKRTIPPIKFSTDLGVTDATDRQDIAVDDIVVLDNLNLRVEGTEDHVAGIRELASKIEANGFYPDKPLAGYVRQDGKVVLTDGHRRLAAVRYLNDQSLDGPVVTTLPVVVSPGTLDDVTIKMIASSEGRELTMLEKGIGVRRLMGNGMDKDEIARRLGCSVKTIDNYLLVASAPAKARDLLLDGRVTSTQVLRAKGDAEKLTAMVKKAAEAGRQRARPSDAPERPIKSLPAAAVAPYGGNTDKTPQQMQADFMTGAPDDSFTVTVTKDADMRTVMQRLAAEIRKRVPHEQDESDNALVNGTITVSVTLQQPEKPKKKRSAKVETPVEAEDAAAGDADSRVPAELAHAIPDDL